MQSSLLNIDTFLFRNLQDIELSSDENKDLKKGLLSEKSLTKTRKNSGLYIDPWGTQLGVGLMGEGLLFTDTFCLREP